MPRKRKDLGAMCLHSNIEKMSQKPAFPRVHALYNNIRKQNKFEGIEETMEQIEQIKKELKRLASVKSRLKKQIGKASYEADMQKVLEQEAHLKELREALDGSNKRTVTQYTVDDIQQLGYEEVCKAIKSIQSKKSNTRWLTPIEGDNEEYRAACRIERMLKERRAELVPTGVSLKADLSNILAQAETLTKEELIAVLQELIG